jgi:hypothetical protein
MTKLETATAQLEEAGKLLDAVCVTIKESKLDGDAARVRRIRQDVANVRKASLGWPRLLEAKARMEAARRQLVI